MRTRRLVTWPFAAFLFGYGAPTNDPTVVSLGDKLLSSAALGLGLAIILGLPLALIFRRGDGELTRGALVGMAVALAITVVLDFAGIGLVGAALYFFSIRGARVRERKVAPARTRPG